MNWTTPQDVLDRWRGSNKPTDLDALQTDITDVEDQILFTYPNIQERIDDKLLPLNLVVSFVSRVVIEYHKTLGNPYQQVSEGAGGFNKSVTYGSAARYSLTLSKADLDRLAPSNPSSVFSINIAPNAKRIGHSGVWYTIKEGFPI